METGLELQYFSTFYLSASVSISRSVGVCSVSGRDGDGLHPSFLTLFSSLSGLSFAWFLKLAREIR